MEDPPGFDDWAESVPVAFRSDPIWNLAAYRYALYLGDLVRDQLPAIRRDLRARTHIDQLNRAVASISANITEGYSRSTGRERAKFFEYAYGSARESRDYLFKVRCALDEKSISDLLSLVTRIIKLLVVMIRGERGEQNGR